MTFESIRAELDADADDGDVRAGDAAIGVMVRILEAVADLFEASADIKHALFLEDKGGVSLVCTSDEIGRQKRRVLPEGATVTGHTTRRINFRVAPDGSRASVVVVGETSQTHPLRIDDSLPTYARKWVDWLTPVPGTCCLVF